MADPLIKHYIVGLLAYLHVRYHYLNCLQNYLAIVHFEF